MMPSERMRLSAQEYSDATCLDFDFAVCDYGQWVEAKIKETDSVPLTEAEKKAKPTKQVPKYTLAKILGLEDDEEAAAYLGAVRTNPDAPRLDLSRFRMSGDDDDRDG